MCLTCGGDGQVMVWYGTVLYGMGCYGRVVYCMVWYGIVVYGMGLYGILLYGIVWCGTVVYGMGCIHSKNWIRWIPESADNLEFSAERLSENAKNIKFAIC